jgi:hypothetical protein
VDIDIDKECLDVILVKGEFDKEDGENESRNGECSRREKLS